MMTHERFEEIKKYTAPPFRLQHDDGYDAIQKLLVMIGELRTHISEMGCEPMDFQAAGPLHYLKVQPHIPPRSEIAMRFMAAMIATDCVDAKQSVLLADELIAELGGGK